MVEKQQWRDPTNRTGLVGAVGVTLLIGLQYPIVDLGSGGPGHTVLSGMVLLVIAACLAATGMVAALRAGRISSGIYAGFLAGALGGVVGGIVDSIIIASAPGLVTQATDGLLGMPSSFGLEVSFCGLALYGAAGVIAGAVGAVVGRLAYRKPQRATAGARV